MWAHDSQATINDIFNEVATTLYDSGLKWYSENDILTSIQDQYNKLVAILQPIERSTFIPKLSSMYYPIMDWLPDFMYVSAIFNPTTNQWLEGRSYKTMKSDNQTYFVVGQPKYVNVVDMQRLLIWPYLPSATGLLYLVYKAAAPTISADHVPVFPHSVSNQLLEYSTIADLYEQAREFKKAQIWWDKLYKPQPTQVRSILDQARLELKDLARMDMENVLEPYRWIFHGGNFRESMWINNETPAGNIDGTNAIFTLAQVPNPTTSLLLINDNHVMFQTIDFQLNGQTITYETAKKPAAGKNHRVFYQVT